MTGPRGALGLLAALAAAVVGGTAFVAPSVSAVPLGPVGAAGGRVPFAATVVAPRASGQGDDQHEDTGHERRPHRTRKVTTSAVVDVHRDDRTRRRSAWELEKTTAQTLVADNYASAVTRGCTDCHAVAVSVQVVVASRNVGDVSATNAADAVTLDCTRCASTALAYQFVVVGAGRLGLTREARTELADLRRQMRRLARHGPQDTLPAQEDALAARVAEVLRTGVVDRERTAPDAAASSAPSTRSAPSGSGVTVRVRRSHDKAHGRSR